MKKVKIIYREPIEAEYKELNVYDDLDDYLKIFNGGKDFIIIGNEDWNYSAPHGAGRTMSRNMAKQILSMEDYKKSMGGIYTTSVNEDTLDEAPMVYKPMEEIIEHIKDTVEVEKVIKPIYNFKAGE